MVAIKITKEEFDRRIKQRFPEENFTILQFNGMGRPCEIKCENCGQIIQVNKASNFLAKNKAYGCKNCHGLWREREQKLEKIKEKYDILDTFVKESHTYYHVRCKNCGHERTTTLKNLYVHLDCGCETNTYRNRTAQEFIDEVNKNSIDGTYKLIGEYRGQTQKVLLQHSCGFIWSVRPADIIHGDTRCPKCRRKISKGALLVAKILDKNKIRYEMEKTLDDSRLRFDFYLENERIKIAIEYNGEQHYKDNGYFRTTLEEQQDRDNRKRQYCKDHNIILYELPYTLSDDELEKKVQDIVNKFNDYSEKK